MTDNIKLPPMPKPHTPPVFATAANTQSVKAGYELGGYEKTPPLFDEHQLEAFAREAVRLNVHGVPAAPQPAHNYGIEKGYTAETVQRLIDEAYASGLEDAAKVCDDISIEAAKQWKERYRPFDQGREHGADECAEAIRALKPKGEE